MELSISRIKTFKACRRLYQLKYIEHIEPTTYPEALEIGKSYHAMIDAYNKGEEVPETMTKESAMFCAYKKYIAPNFKVTASEHQMGRRLSTGDKLIGITDGIAEDGCLVEHKTTGGDITEQYEYNLQWDEQILAYMFLSGKREMWYTICKKPTIRQKQNETDEEFYHRMLEWYDDETETKIRLLKIERTDEDIEQFETALTKMCVEMRDAGISGNYYRNVCHCQVWGGRCEYSPICLNNDLSGEFVGFIKNQY